MSPTQSISRSQPWSVSFANSTHFSLPHQSPQSSRRFVFPLHPSTVFDFYRTLTRIRINVVRAYDLPFFILLLDTSPQHTQPRLDLTRAPAHLPHKTFESRLLSISTLELCLIGFVHRWFPAVCFDRFSRHRLVSRPEHGQPLVVEVLSSGFQDA